MASSMIPAIYIQQFWDTMCYDSTTGMYKCQLDEQWFNLHKEIIIDSLQITPANDNDLFVAPPSSDIVIEYVNTLGYPSTLKNVSAMSINSLYQPWRAILSMINMCLTGKTAGYDRPRHPVLQILLGSIRKDGRKIFGMPIPDALLTDEIKRAPYYGEYLERVAMYQQYLDEERGKAWEEGVTESPKATKVTKHKKDQGKKRKSVKETSDAPSPAKRSKAGKVKKKRMPKGPIQLVDEFVDEGVLEKELVYGDEEANLQRALELSLKDQRERTQGPACLVVFREPDSGRFQPLPERRTPMPTEPSRIAYSPSLDADLAPTDSETESDEEVPGINVGDQDEGQAPGVQDEGQARPNPSLQDEV
ncbi:retrovirus-related pol polyprotein from transposon TNT 1-94 [Tanacetum coccineum]